MGPRRVWFGFEGDWTAEEQATFWEAADAWNEQCGYDLFRYEPGGDWLMARKAERPADDPMPIIARASPEHGISFYRESFGNMRLLRATTMHEMGHTLGLWHTDGGIMNPEVRTADASIRDCILAETYSLLN